jgi:uncharacterized repeat protein (TIGR01451 family)
MPYQALNTVTYSVTQWAADPAEATVEFLALQSENAYAQITATTANVELSDPVSWSVMVYDYAGQAGSGLAAVIVLPRNGDDILLDELDEPTAYQGARGSSFTPGYTLAAATVDIEESSADVVLYYTTAGNPSTDVNQPANWLPVAGAMTSELAAATALKVVAVSDEIAATVARVNVTIQPAVNAKGDRYALWLGEVELKHGDSEPAATVAMLWPNIATVVTSEITGLVWWDDSNDGTPSGDDGAAEPGIAGVSVSLYAADAAGQPSGEALRHATTDTNGGYSFTDSHSGRYVAVISGDAQISATVTSYYGEELAIEQTYSYRNRYYQSASLTSTVIAVPVGGVVTGVSFGFHIPNPEVALDKAAGSIACSSGMCTLNWEVTVTNTGKDVLRNTSVTDRLPDTVSNLTASAATPVRFVKTFATVYSGMVALDDEGNLWRWGSFGTAILAPAQVPLAGETVRQVDVGREVWVITDQGHLWHWRNSGTPALLDLEGEIPVKAYDFGSIGTFVVTVEGSVWSIDSANKFGEAGNGSTDKQTAPYRINIGNDKAISVSSSLHQSDRYRDEGVVIALTESGNLWAWGSNRYGAVGNDDSGEGSMQTTPYLVAGPSADGVVQAAVLGEAPCMAVAALTKLGELWTWGCNSSGMLGTGDETMRTTPYNLGFLGGEEVTQFAFGKAGSSRYGEADMYPATMYAVTESGKLWAWGAGVYCAIGDGGDSDRSVPVQITALDGKNIVQVIPSSGSDPGGTVFAVSDSGELWAWGRNIYGSVGNGIDSNEIGGYGYQALPYRLNEKLGDEMVIQVYSKLGTVNYVVTESGTLWAWGRNNYGQMGNGTTANQLEPYRLWLPGGEKIVFQTLSILDDTETMSVVTESGKLWTWGRNNYGQVGDSTTTNRLTPYNPRVSVPDSQLTLMSMTSVGGWTDRVYEVPGDIYPGESRTFLIVASVTQTTTQQVVVNQAFVDSPLTPIAGLLPDSRFTPEPPTVPEVAEVNEDGVPGNTTCNTDADQPDFQTSEDSCDQVPLIVPTYTTAPGQLRGLVWVDVNDDGKRSDDESIRVPGVAVTLLYSGSIVAETLTDANGEYSFTAPHASYSFYTVQFGISGVDVCAVLDNAAGCGSKTFGFAKANIGADAADSDPNQTTGLTNGYTIRSNFITENVDAGVVPFAAAASVDKWLSTGSAASDGPHSGSVSVDVPEGETGTSAQKVSFSITNNGDEDLTEFAFADSTSAGDPVVWGTSGSSVSCVRSPQGVNVVFTLDAATGVWAAPPNMMLLPNRSLTCEGSLAAMPRGTSHDDTVTFTARGSLSKTLISATDRLVLTADGWSNVAVFYQDSDGNDLAATEVMPGHPGTPYTTTAAIIPGYTLAVTPDNASGVYPADGLTTSVVYVYESNVVAVKTSDPADGSKVRPGDDITFTLTFENVTADVTAVDFTDFLGSVLTGADFDSTSVTATGGLIVALNADTSTLRVTGSLEAGASGTVTYTAQVNSAAELYQLLVNRVVHTGFSPEVCQEGDEDCEVGELVCVTDDLTCTVHEVSYPWLQLPFTGGGGAGLVLIPLLLSTGFSVGAVRLKQGRRAPDSGAGFGALRKSAVFRKRNRHVYTSSSGLGVRAFRCSSWRPFSRPHP